MKLLHQLSWRRRVARKIGSRLLHWAENNGDCRISLNGEAWLLREVFSDWAVGAGEVGGADRMVFDVGANVGEFTYQVFAAAGRAGVIARVVAFEPSPTCQKSLSDRFAPDRRFQLVPAAVADIGTPMPLFSPEPRSGHASLVRRTTSIACESQMVDVIRLDAFMDDRAIKRVDFLKLDVEGAELKVLRGLGDRLNPSIVPVIQFEYGGTTLDAGVRLRDLYDLLEGAGYAVGKLMPTSVNLRRYAPWMENFEYANYVAVPREMPTGKRA